nr:hypothetical protein [Ralstonia sp. A12]
MRHGGSQLFATGHPRTTGTFYTSMTAEMGGGLYQYLADRIAMAVSAGELSLPVIRNEGANAWFPGKGVDFMSHLEFRLTEWLDGREIGMTALRIPRRRSDFDSPEARQLVRDPAFSHDGHAAMMKHVDSRHIATTLNHVERLFGALLHAALGTEVLMPKLGEIHWWLVHAMPDERGSSAKAELSVRAVAAAHGVELPPFRRGVVPDLEAFAVDRSRFSANYARWFESADDVQVQA